jgi:hypothetical protein
MYVKIMNDAGLRNILYDLSSVYAKETALS